MFEIVSITLLLLQELPKNSVNRNIFNAVKLLYESIHKGSTKNSDMSFKERKWGRNSTVMQHKSYKLE